LALLVALATVTAAIPSHAQAPPAGGEKEDPKRQAEALAAFMKGKAEFGGGKFEQALESFRRSYELQASPNSHLMVAKCLEAMKRDIEAYNEVLAVEEEASKAAEADRKYLETLNAARDVRSSISRRIGRIKLSVPGGFDALGESARIQVGDSELERDRWSKEIAVLPGETTITITTDRGEKSQTVDVKAGDDLAVALEVPGAKQPVEPPPPDPEPVEKEDDWFKENRRIIAYSLGGVGAAGMILFGVFGGLTLSKFGDLEERCPNGACPPGSQADIDDGSTYQVVANVSLVIGLVGLAAGTGLFVWDIVEEEPEGGEDSGRKLRVVPGPGRIDLQGTF
jgi:hypothetical protein